MNHHIFIAVATFLFYIILKQYNNKKRFKKNKKSSNLIYVFFLPCTLYLFKYIYCNNNFVSNINITKQSDSILSNPYPESLSTN